jgi:hypothetical protein
VGDARPLHGEGAEGALRYSVNARIDGRIFEEMSLDVNLIDPRDARPVELVVVQRNPFEFVGEPSLEIPMVTPGQQLAEKLHAYTRRYEDERSSRAKDLFDMLVIADQVQLPSGARLSDAVQDTFQVRVTRWPPELVQPPPDWERPWIGFVTDYPLPWNTLDAAFAALTQFWNPVLTGTAADGRCRLASGPLALEISPQPDPNPQLRPPHHECPRESISCRRWDRRAMRSVRP